MDSVPCEQLLPDLWLFRDSCNVYVLRDGDHGLAVDYGSGADGGPRPGGRPLLSGHRLHSACPPEKSHPSGKQSRRLPLATVMHPSQHRRRDPCGPAVAVGQAVPAGNPIWALKHNEVGANPSV